MRERMITAVLGILLILYALFFNAFVFNMLVALVVALCSFELVKMFAQEEQAWVDFLPLLGSALFYGAYFLYPEAWASLALALMVFIFVSVFIIAYPRYPFREFFHSFFIPIYGGWAAVHLMVIFHGPQGLRQLLYFLVAIWLCDTGAYFSGRFFGQRKLAPHLSPNKTIEGAIGGVMLSVLAGLLFNSLFPVFSSAFLAMAFSLFMALGGMLGDLFESSLKRQCRVKDSGNILLGHGGFLDRFDSILFTAPLAAYLYQIGQSTALVL